MENYTHERVEYWDDAVSSDGKAQAVGIRVLPESINRHRKTSLFSTIEKILNKHTTPTDEMKVLDAGCGTGIYSEFYSALGANVAGVDLSQEAVNTVSEYLPGESYQSSLDDLPFEDNSFDIVHSFSVLYHIIDDDEWKRSLEELVRVCRNGGLFVLRVEWVDKNMQVADHVRYRDRERYRAVMDDLGCELEAIETFDDVVPFRPVFSLLRRLSLPQVAEKFGDVVGNAGLLSENPDQRVVVFRVTK